MSRAKSPDSIKAHPRTKRIGDSLCQNSSFLKLFGDIPVFCEKKWMKLESLLKPTAAAIWLMFMSVCLSSSFALFSLEISTYSYGEIPVCYLNTREKLVTLIYPLSARVFTLRFSLRCVET